MMINRIPGATRVLAKDQPEYSQLPIRDEKRADGVNSMVSSWSPTPDELARLNAGAPVYLGILGTVHPPVILGVGEVPSEEV